jgi:thioredoxin-related protein
MKRHSISYFLLITVLAAAFIGSAPYVSTADLVRWHAYDEGMSLGKAEGKKAFISFYADWCQYCRTMDKETFTDAAVIAYLNENFIPIKVDVEREKHIALQYHINPLPDTWFFSQTGDVIGNKPGYMSAKELLPVLHFIHTESYLKMGYAEFLKTF